MAPSGGSKPFFGPPRPPAEAVEPRVLRVKHGEDNLFDMEERFIGLQRGTTVEERTFAEIRKCYHKHLMQATQFPSLLDFPEAVFWSGQIKAAGWYEDIEQHPALETDGMQFYHESISMQNICVDIVNTWDKGIRNHKRTGLTPFIITVVRTPLLFPVVAALRGYFANLRPDIPCRVGVVLPGQEMVQGNFAGSDGSKNVIDVLVLPLRCLRNSHNFPRCWHLIHFEVVPDKALLWDINQRIAPLPRPGHTNEPALIQAMGFYKPYGMFVDPWEHMKQSWCENALSYNKKLIEFAQLWTLPN